MAKIKYKEHRFNRQTAKLLASLVSVVGEYENQGYRMTLRQLYYQLVSRNIIPNQKNAYARLGRILKEARLAGIVDWNFIEDRIRISEMPREYNDLAALVNAAVESYRLPRWSDQPNYVEVWVEKDALSGVLYDVTEPYHVRLMVDRGFSSATAMHDAAKRFRRAMVNGKTCHLLYFGDHDPSGENMAADVKNRLELFGCPVCVSWLAITKEQVERHQLPSNTIKRSDSRSKKYELAHGSQSWELDALPPNVLVDLLKARLDQLLDRGKYEAVMEQEESDKKRLLEIARSNRRDSESD